MIIFLSGVSCSGKSQLAKHLLQILDDPFVYHNFDFLVPAMLPHEESFKPQYEMSDRTYVRRIDINLYRKLETHEPGIIETTYKFIKTLDDCAFNVIVDAILWDEVLDSILTILSGNKSNQYIVGIYCPLHELERRVNKKKNRKWENVIKQYEIFHGKKIYDVTVDTFKHKLPKCAQIIKEHISYKRPYALEEYRKR